MVWSKLWAVRVMGKKGSSVATRATRCVIGMVWGARVWKGRRRLRFRVRRVRAN